MCDFQKLNTSKAYWLNALTDFLSEHVHQWFREEVEVIELDKWQMFGATEKQEE